VIDGVIVCPAYIEPGRVTVDSVHWARTSEGMIPVAHSEFAKDASFGYRNSDLRDWVEERPAGGFRGTESLESRWTTSASAAPIASSRSCPNFKNANPLS
jgi:uncharacterized protein YgbK (DUF1537 family)